MKTHYLIPLFFLFSLVTIPSTLYGQLQPPAEICNNGIDDDGDGLIDCFDPDCCTPACATNYYNECPPPSCQFRPDSGALVFVEEWSYGNDWHEYNTPIVGDLDGDGIPEVIGKQGPYVLGTQGYDDLLIINGRTGLLEATVQTPILQWINNAVGIMDVDGNGYGEIYLTTAHNPTNVLDRNRLICYDYNPVTQAYFFKWRSVGRVNQPTGQANNGNNNLPNFADFNQDGTPEIYVRNQIFNGLTGVQIVNGDTNSVGANTYYGVNSRFAFPLAIDVLPDAACPDCAGPELVAGNQVYSVFIDPVTPANSRMTVQREAPNKLDGYTSIVDIDRDGDLDGIISTSLSATQAEVYVWELQTNTVLYSFIMNTSNHAIARANAADFDGDGLPEFGICTANRYTVLEVQAGALVQKWSIPTTDVSGGTSSTVFDFEGDGKFEVIYRDETNLNVYDGATGQVLFQTPCASGTSNEYPTIADVDADGETELLCSCGGELKAFKSGNQPWVPTRKLWNQQSFHNTNVNEDLTIPRQIQSPHIVGDSILLNTFLSTIQLKDYPSPDISTEIEFLGCLGDSLLLEITLCNEGNLQYPVGMPLTFYPQNPTTNLTFPLYTALTPVSVDTGQCRSYTAVLPNLGGGTFYAVANDDFSIGTPYNLTADFPVTSVGECDFENNIDSVTITLPQVTLPDTLRACSPDSLVLAAGPGWASYQWSTGFASDSLWVKQSGVYTVIVEDSQNCFTSDDAWVRILDAIILPGDTTVCQGDTLVVQSRADSFTVSNPLTYLWNTGTRINSISNPILISQNTQVINIATDGILTCTDTSVISIIDRPQVDLGADSVSLCIGDSIWLVHPAVMVTNLWQNGSNADSIIANQAGIYWLEASNVCGAVRDSVVIDVLTVPNPVDLGIDTLICDADNIMLNATQPNVTYQWQDNSINPTFAANGPGLYWVIVSNQCGSQADSILISPLADPLPFSLGADTTLCLGDAVWLNHRQAQLNNLWVNNTTGDSLLVQAAGLYWLEINNLCGSLRDSININYITVPSPVDLGPDTLICVGDTISLDATQANVAYQWQDNSINPTFTAITPALYWVRVSNQCGAQIDSIVVLPLADPAAFNLGVDTTLCLGDSIWLNHRQAQLDNMWVDNSIGDSLLVQTAGVYWLEISNLCGSLRDSIDITYISVPAAVDLGRDTLICGGDNIVLHAAQPNVNYLWQDGSIDDSLTTSGTGIYWVIVANQCGQQNDSIEIDLLPDPMAFSLGPDTTLCEATSLWINHSQAQTTNLWVDNSIADSFLVQTAGLYWLEVSNRCGSVRDSIEVDILVVPNPFSLGNDSTLCEGQTVLLRNTSPGLDFLWQDGRITPTYLVTNPGQYWLEASNRCGAVRDTIEIDYLLPPAPFSLGDDLNLCIGDSFFIAFPLQNRVDYLWNDGLTDPFRYVFEQGDYLLTASNKCGVEDDEFNVAIVDSPNVVLPMDTILCNDQLLTLDFFDPNIDYYLWEDGSTRPGAFIEQPGTYEISVGNLCDTLRSGFTVDFEPCHCSVFMANAFSPNNDGYNDNYYPGFECNADFVTFQIFDRWGHLVFQSNSLDAAWDGNYLDKSSPEGVYVWVLQVDWTEDGIPKSTLQRGTVTLIR